jgi:hypothetical protein
MEIRARGCYGYHYKCFDWKEPSVLSIQKTAFIDLLRVQDFYPIEAGFFKDGILDFQLKFVTLP